MRIHHLLLLLKLPSQTHSSLSQSLLFRLQTTLNSHAPFNLHCTLFPKSDNLLLPLCRSSKWDPNEESFKNKTFNFNFKKTEGDEDDDEFKSEDVCDSLLEEYIDSIWILKVFNSYGWSLPFIILSILLASGLKAFLMALALPLAQSTIWFFLQKIGDSTNYKNLPKMKSKRKSRVQRVSSVVTAKRDRAYPSWVPGEDVSADNWSNDGDSSFGGWDELEWGRDFAGASPKSEQRASRSQKETFQDNLTRLERRSETPLLLRLLVSLFPLMSCWIKIF